jgi:hypothetical protein
VGAGLCLAGVMGHTSWSAFGSNINDAAPGVIVFVVGLFFVIITRFKVRDTMQVGGGGGNQLKRMLRSISYYPD